jgi:hypothetical protein
MYPPRYHEVPHHEISCIVHLLHPFSFKYFLFLKHVYITGDLMLSCRLHVNYLGDHILLTANGYVVYANEQPIQLKVHKVKSPHIQQSVKVPLHVGVWLASPARRA